LTAAEGRKFGFTVGFAFLALGAFAMWRGKQRTSMVLLSLGGVLVVAALVVPTLLGPVEKAWMGLAHLISKVTTPIFMSIVYFVVMTPIGFLRRMSAGKMGAPKSSSVSNWDAHTPAVVRRESMERQF
jgi:vacuolar-type H+-ATPase subunit I/STV1